MKMTFASLTSVAVLSLTMVACQANTVGNTCAVDSDCDRGQTCFTVGFPGGYCSKGCAREGSTTDCPGGYICTRSSGAVAGNVSFFCSNECTVDTDCRNDTTSDGGLIIYQCRAVTSSEKKACAP
ncbi:MAG: hypothetical protein JNK82_28815 [Myxococcaceae bacterium]|nr:hypothetical protein [Myxococcaceae bacterium]